MKHLPVVAKFLTILAIFGVFVIGATVYMTAEMRSLTTGFTNDDKSAQAAAFDATVASQAMDGVDANIGWLLVADQPAKKQYEMNRLTSNAKRVDNALDAAAVALPALASQFEAMRQRGDDALATPSCAQTIALGQQMPEPAGMLQAQNALLIDCQNSVSSVILDMYKVVQASQTYALHDQAALTNEADETVFNAFALILIGLVAVLIGGFFAIRAWVVTPIKGLQSAMGKLAGGNLQANVAGGERKDEIGGMARAVQVFKDMGLEKLQLEEEAREVAARAEAERDRHEAERAAVAAQQQFVVDSVAAGLEKLSGGDLLFRLTEAFSTDYEKLRGDFNAAMNKLQVTMQAIAANTQGVRGGAGEITQASDDLSRRTEQQAASLEETAAALDEITATVRRTAEVANEARDLVSTSKTDAEHSGVVVRDTVQAMSGIETSSRQIGNIIGVIDEIAFQTNLLALNAGVEAARAGDAGRGFAVVATEVRALAQRSAEAAKEIKGLISTSNSQVGSGVKSVAETSTALARIVEQVAEMNRLVGDIAASAEVQATGLNEVNAAINQMDQVTQKNAAMVEEATAASHALAGEAAELARLVGLFQVGEEQAPAMVRAEPRRAMRAHVPAPRTPSPSSRPQARAVPVKSGAEDWDEF
jgi:methyl-accepting chemotaxis protein